ncbi:MAG: hypothetical protein MUF54_07330 [Polyangiaceae bacterium]|nr:hypothetical protein [Polyangiaceae bacterium]
MEFVSHTLPHVDGLLLRVLQQADDATLTLDTAAASLTVNLSDIARSFAGHRPVGDDVNGVSFYAFAHRPGCADGLVFGRYRRLANQVGRFHLRVVEDHGLEIGRLRGIYGYSHRLDNQVYFGKYVSLGGEHRGRARGQYADGTFAGLWHTDNPATGTMRELYWEGPDGRPGSGLAIGHWAESCRATGAQ